MRQRSVIRARSNDEEQLLLYQMLIGNGPIIRSWRSVPLSKTDGESLLPEWCNNEADQSTFLEVHIVQCRKVSKEMREPAYPSPSPRCRSIIQTWDEGRRRRIWGKGGVEVRTGEVVGGLVWFNTFASFIKGGWYFSRTPTFSYISHVASFHVVHLCRKMRSSNAMK